jgi:RNA recognition motif-containing protein
MYNDKFLRNLISKDSDRGIDINIIFNFNKVKQMLIVIPDEEAKMSLLKKSIEHSKKLKLSNNKIIRREEFEMSKLDQAEIDKKTIYVENIPTEANHEVLVKLFSRHGRVLHISIPKFKDTKQPKGFVFVTFDKQEEATQALKQCNNFIPKELIEISGNKSGAQPLSIITKVDWLTKKAEFKLLKNELIKENKDIFAECIRQSPESINQLTQNTLVKISNLPVGKLDRYEIRTWISHFVEPAFVDYKPKDDTCFVRFSHPILAQSFLNKLQNEEDFNFKDRKPFAMLVLGEEQDNYFKLVEKLKVEYKREKCSTK